MVVGISAFVIMMPQTITASLATTSPLLTEELTKAEVTGVLATSNTGTNGLIGAIIIGLLAVFAGTDLLTIISTFIAEPLKSIMNAGPWAVILIYTLANLLFCVGIHQSTISGATVEPILTMLIVDNMATYASGGAIQSDHYMNMQIINSFALIGGSGCTLCLLLGTFLFSKSKTTKTVSKMSILPGLFNINEPVIYGYPIVFNLPLMIPFVLIPDLFIGITYGLTCAG